MKKRTALNCFTLLLLLISSALILSAEDNDSLDKTVNTSYASVLVSKSAKVEQKVKYKAPSPSISLDSFDYHMNNNELVFEWETTKEINSFMFELQRFNRAAGKWEKVGHVVAFGSTRETKTYKLLEQESPLGITPYRLKIQYLNGEVKYSPEIYVKVKNLFEINNYFNNSGAIGNIRYQLEKDSKIQVNILDSDGNTVAEIMNAYQKEGTHELECKLGSLEPGIYFINMNAESIGNNAAFSDTQKIVSVK